MLAAPPLSLYVHVPWCVRKCPYCDFNSHRAPEGLPETDYLEALLADLTADLPWVQDRPLQSIFIGGGTPSLMSAAFMQALLDGFRARLPLAENAEITLEANPGTADAGHFPGYRAAGVNRLSLGVQSFNDRHLEALGRIHDADAARHAFALARAAGFDNINLDLMHGLPGQTLEAAVTDLETGLDLAPEHLSWYQLTLEPNTEFHRRPPPLPDDDLVSDLQDAGWTALARAGYGRYETSAFARRGRTARHNLNYWQFGDYLGIGAGAHGKLTFPAEDRIVRTRKTRMPEHYLNRQGSRLTDQTEVTPEERPLEFMLNALRLTEGFEESLFPARTGLALATVAKPLECLVQDGLLTWQAGRIAPTPKGRLFVNHLLEAFL